jgi:hypothetical protein
MWHMHWPPAPTKPTVWLKTMTRGRFVVRAALIAAAFYGIHIAIEGLTGGDIGVGARSFIAVFFGLTMAGFTDFWTARRLKRALPRRP